MSVLVVGISHNSAPVSLLERVALDTDGVTKLIADAQASTTVAETAVIATCNRLEVYAEVDRFHGSVEELSRLLVERAGETTESMLPHLYVHYEDGAVSHLFHVAAGLDSMAVGEGQILGQTREALRSGQEQGSVGPALNVLFQQALRVGKRARAETGIDRAAPTLVSAAVERVTARGRRRPARGRARRGRHGRPRHRHRGAQRRGRRGRRQPDPRATPRGWPPSTASGPRRSRTSTPSSPTPTCWSPAPARPACWSPPPSCTPPAPTTGRWPSPTWRCPHDVEPAAADLPGVRLIGLADLAEELRETEAGREVADVRRIVGEEITAFLAARRQASVTPTVVAIRSMATEVVDAEMARLVARRPDLDDEARAQVLQTLRRVADKLLHQPTVRVKELANETGAVSYATALAELFALDPEAVDAVTRPSGEAMQ